MPETVSVREDLQIIQVDSYGDVTAKDLEGTLKAVTAIRQERGLTRVLVDATAKVSSPSTVSVFEFGSELAEHIRDMKVAVAGSTERDPELGFLQTVTANRGAHLHIFESVDAALTWLKAQPGEADPDG
jgi:hypothetical protein